MTNDEFNEPKPKRFCGLCPQRGRLLPLRRGALACVECAGITNDQWGATEGLAPGDYDAYASFAKQLRNTRRHQTECRHKNVMVSTRPWCSTCGLVVGREHPLRAAVLEVIERMGREAPPEMMRQARRGGEIAMLTAGIGRPLGGGACG